MSDQRRQFRKMGDDGIALILRGTRTLLNGELGPHDAGRLDRGLLDVASEAGIAEKDL
jgi:hypothetical protein